MKKNYGLLLIVFVAFLPSCRVLYPNLMFQEKGYQYFEMARKQIDEYVIEPGDQLGYKVYSRDGFRLIDIIGGGGGVGTVGTGGGASIDYFVDKEGFIRLPVLGELFVKGYTEKELARVLADKLAGLFVDPYVIVTVTNRRVYLFNGSSSGVITLNPYPTNLFEVIARSGGIQGSAKAYKIKVIRGYLKNPEILIIDLSTIEGMRKADLILQSNDIIYIEQKQTNVVSLALNELTPYLGAISTIIGVVLLTRAYNL